MARRRGVSNDRTLTRSDDAHEERFMVEFISRTHRVDPEFERQVESGDPLEPGVTTSVEPNWVADHTPVAAIGMAATQSARRPRRLPRTDNATTKTAWRASRNQINRPEGSSTIFLHHSIDVL